MQDDFIETSTTLQTTRWGAVKILLGWKVRVTVRTNVEAAEGGVKALASVGSTQAIPPFWWLCLVAIFGPIQKEPR